MDFRQMAFIPKNSRPFFLYGALALFLMACPALAQTASPVSPTPPASPAMPVTAVAAPAAAVVPAPAASAPASPYNAPVPALHSAPIKPLLNTSDAARQALSAIVQNQPVAPKVEMSADRNFIALYLACAGYSNRADRLSCYDNIALQMGLMTPDEKAKQDQLVQTFGLWEVVETQDEMNRTRFLLKLDSNAAVVSHSGLSLHPTLTLSCQQATTDLYLNWKYSLIQTPGVSHFPVLFAFDNDRQSQEDWRLTDDHYAVSPPDVAKFIRAMRTHSKLNIVVSPEGENTSSTFYDLTGFPNALDLLIKKCYTNPPPAPDTRGSPQ
jgi:hypothetical protein